MAAPPDLASMLGTIAGLMNQGVPARMYRELQPFLGRLAAAATTKWGTHLVEGQECYRCRRAALGLCCKCGDQTCLEHAWFSADADFLCHGCAAKPKKASKPRPQVRSLDPERDEALKTLGLGSDASWEQVQARFRELAKSHPDRAKGDKRRAEEKFKKVTAAYELLKRRRQAA